MASYPKLVQIAWDVIEKFIADWQAEPYRYVNELSFQAELYSRIKTVIELTGYGTLEGRYTKDIAKGYKDKQHWSRVVCETAMHYKWTDGGYYKFFPDIIIKDDIKEFKNPPDAIDYGNWPALLLIEIKVDAKDDDKNNGDIEKLKILLKNGKDAQYGCWLNFRFKPLDKNVTFNWANVEKIGNLFKCNIYLPFRKEPDDFK